jgi:subtilase family serine protease
MVINGAHLYTPHQMRVAYGVQSLIDQGFTGKGQTVVIVDSFGSPTVQQDLDAFDTYYHLPKPTLTVIAPLGTKPFDASNQDMVGWAYETEEDVETVHALAPDASIVLLTSPVSETEGTIGLPEFLQLEQYAVQHFPGSPVSQSWNASEATLTDSAGRALVQQWDDFFHQAATKEHMTFFAGSGDWGASNYVDLQGQRLASQPTSGFPADDPWVTAVGGTTLNITGGTIQETAWPESGGGLSAFYATPQYQQSLSSNVQSLLQGKRGIPDVASSADTRHGLGIYVQGQWTVSNGTSAGSPVWSALTAIANQKAGHPLGFLNPLLYKLGTSGRYGQDFRDITSGSNAVNGSGVHVSGYSAGTGWDAVTGLGSPNAAHLIPDLIAAGAS